MAEFRRTTNPGLYRPFSAQTAAVYHHLRHSRRARFCWHNCGLHMSPAPDQPSYMLPIPGCICSWSVLDMSQCVSNNRILTVETSSAPLSWARFRITMFSPRRGGPAYCWVWLPRAADHTHSWADCVRTDARAHANMRTLLFEHHLYPQLHTTAYAFSRSSACTHARKHVDTHEDRKHVQSVYTRNTYIMLTQLSAQCTPSPITYVSH